MGNHMRERQPNFILYCAQAMQERGSMQIHSAIIQICRQATRRFIITTQPHHIHSTAAAASAPAALIECINILHAVVMRIIRILFMGGENTVVPYRIRILTASTIAFDATNVLLRWFWLRFRNRFLHLCTSNWTELLILFSQPTSAKDNNIWSIHSYRKLSIYYALSWPRHDKRIFISMEIDIIIKEKPIIQFNCSSHRTICLHVSSRLTILMTFKPP